MTIDRQLLRALRADMDRAFADLGKKHGLLIKTGRGTFTETTATLKVEIADSGAVTSGNITSPKDLKYRAAWPRFADSLNMQVEWLDRTFTGYDGETYTIIGIAPSRPKYPVATKRDRDGVTVFHNNRGVINIMASQKPASKRPRS